MSEKYIKIKALHAETGEFQEKILTLATGVQGDCLVGRHPNCDLVLNSSEVSRIHGRIWCHEGKCFFTDLGSTDGSQIDDQEVQIDQGYLLKPDSLLRIGGFVLMFAEMPFNNNDSHYTSRNRLALSSGKLTVRCIQAIAETHDVKTFRFVTSPPVLFSYKPGQFVTLELEIEGKKVMRSYSFSSTPSRPHTLEITVKRVPPPIDAPDAPPGLVSNWLHDNITVGSQVKLIGPRGKFTCVDNLSEKLLFISAGSGITPIMSMSRWLCDTGANVDVVFIYSARSSRDIIFRHELESMAARSPNFKLAITTTRKEPGQAWQGYSGRLNELMLQAIAPDFRERTVYICGPNPFMEAVKTMLEALGFPMNNYYEESFSSPRKKPFVKARRGDSETQSFNFPVSLRGKRETCTEGKEKITSMNATRDQSPVVVLTKSGKEIACDGEDIILAVAEQEGIELPSGCRMGTCGTCKLPLLEGKVHYDDDPQCEPGHLLPCIAKPIGRVVIEA